MSISPTKHLIGLLLVAAFMPAAHAADAMTSVLGGQAVYDATTNLTWVSDANLLASNTFGLSYGVSLGVVSNMNAEIFSNGTANWGGAEKWIAAMNATNYLGYNNWRIPSPVSPNAMCPSSGFPSNCTGSDLGNLFYNGLGGAAGQSITSQHNANYNLFSNIPAVGYWSGTEYISPGNEWPFDFFDGHTPSNGLGTYFVWAVRSGGVAAVPEPETYALMLAGLGLVAVMARRKSTKTN